MASRARRIHDQEESCGIAKALEKASRVDVIEAGFAIASRVILPPSK